MNFNVSNKTKRKSGIYIISNSIDSRVYIGSTKDFYRRFLTHTNFLIKNKHHCTHLQKFFNKYGDCLSFSVLIVLNKMTKASAEFNENKYLKKYKNKFNSKPDAFTMLGYKFDDTVRIKMIETITKIKNTPEYKKRQSDIAKSLWKDKEFIKKRKKNHLKSVTSSEYRKKMSEIVKKRWSNPEYKERVLKSKMIASQRDEYKEKARTQMTGSKNNNSILTEKIVYKIKIEILKKEMTLQKIADKFNVKKSLIEDMKYRNSWKHVVIR